MPLRSDPAPAAPVPSDAEARDLAAPLLAWYRRHRRDLPWRRTRDPYRIWLSEIMLQQTRVETVIPYYERFVVRFPTVDHLARATQDEVMKAWAGLGYYSRARNLKAAAERVAAAGGAFPPSRAGLLELPGIGRYTAGAVASIAFGEAVPAVDGNVERVLARRFALSDDLARPATKRRFEALATAMIPRGDASDFNQALMELGATVCTPVAPACLVCPLRERCAAHAAGAETRYPVKTKRTVQRDETTLAAAVLAEGRLLVVRGEGRGLLGGLWGLPALRWDGAGEPGRRLGAHLREACGVRARGLRAVGEVGHVFTHIRMTYRLFAAEADRTAPADDPSDRIRWADRDALGALAFSKAMRKVLALLAEPAP